MMHSTKTNLQCLPSTCEKRFDKLENRFDTLEKDVNGIKLILQENSDAIQKLGVLFEEHKDMLKLVLKKLDSTMKLEDRVEILENKSDKYSSDIDLLKLAIRSR